MVARPAEPDDLVGVIACALQFLTYQPTPECVAELFAQSGEQGGMFVAEQGGTIIGFLCALKLPHPFTGRDYVNVVAWWVPEDRRASGAGLALLRQLLRWCSTQQLDMVTISAPTSSRLGTLLQAVGFAPVETVHMKGRTWL